MKDETWRRCLDCANFVARTLPYCNAFEAYVSSYDAKLPSQCQNFKQRSVQKEKEDEKEN